ncbi:MAG: 50S ribosomal protein L28 [Candidatus Caenarcaniphilales bacterium]|nr:50S ribosomal protein L28 [Candidatus Caenarcaniphilales bacterium]
MSKFIKSKSGRVCQVTGKKAIKGWRYSFLRSHFNPTSKRRFEVNLQTIKTVDENGTPVRVKVAASIIKRCPDIKVSLTNLSEKKLRRRPKGKQKKELLEFIESLG